MSSSYIKIVRIKKRFSEFNSKAIEKFSLDEVISNIKKPNESDSLYEYIQADSVTRFFMDIENIIDKSIVVGNSILEQIIGDFINFMEVFNIHFTRISVTKNFNSENHEGQSFHVIFDGPYLKNFTEMKYWMYAFLALYPSNQKYVDPIVYRVDRMFKLPNQYGVNKEGEHIRENSLNIHKPYYVYMNGGNPLTCDKSIRHYRKIRNINDEELQYFVIQVNKNNLSDTDYIVEYPFDCGETSKIKVRGISQEWMTSKKNVDVQKDNELKSGISFKCLKFKIMTSYEERIKFVDAVMKDNNESQLKGYLNDLSLEQIDQLLTIALNTV